MSAAIEMSGTYVQPTYDRSPLVISKGKGSWVWDLTGRRYLDFFPGWAASGLGHCHPRVMNALRDQVGKILHVPNNYFTVAQGRLAEKIIQTSFPGKVFFANSGAEANEAAVKLARRWGGKDRYEIITMAGSFHGRTLAMVSATGQAKVASGFEPLPEGFVHVPFNDMEAVRRVFNKKTAAVLLEFIQGEGGIREAEPGFVRDLAAFCKEKNLLLMADEVQSGMGRTGKYYAWQHYGVTPDVMTLAKSLGGGFPIGAMVAGSRVQDTLGPGSHGSTFGGSPLACRAGLAAFEAIEREGLLKQASLMGEFLKMELEKLKGGSSPVVAVRGRGLMLGVELNSPGAGVVARAREQGLLINCTQEKILRILPALTVTRGEIKKAVRILTRVLGAQETPHAS
ncbi:MAG: aspartate aminotransferase family protein [Candidatus Omnitrophica bacterium]|nr:aspartate aminotransferase family protein [Candidatus Omnitrophota bacterium]